MVGIGHSGMVEQRSHLLPALAPPAPAAGTGATACTRHWHPVLAPITPHCQRVQVVAASPNYPSGLLHLPRLLRDDLNWHPPLAPAVGNGPTRTYCRHQSRHSNPLLVPTTLAPTAGARVTTCTR
ncbi:hypothetical protein MDA_GLEAN10010803 [Myotis davidii]|uniref:Uncharacterized protein n=1 Tax=Myotis davidii TaxID=225400 RepID=L5LMG0_MYODS|nr:hypothetical protein MDA_GLEAN10010803 [Myotis davidii]